MRTVHYALVIEGGAQKQRNLSMIAKPVIECGYDFKVTGVVCFQGGGAV